MTELARQNYRYALRERRANRSKFAQRMILVGLLIVVALVLSARSNDAAPSCTDPNTGMPIDCQSLSR